MYKYLLALLLFPVVACGQTTKTIKVNVPGYGACNVIIYDPSPGTSQQAVVMFPGDGEAGTDANKLYVNGPLKFVKAGWKPNFKVIGAQPLTGHAGPPFVHAVLTELSKPVYNITSFSLTGLSGGSYSALTYIQGQANPIPIKNIVSMGTVSEYGTARVDQFKNTPVWNFVGDNDGFAYNETIAFDKALKAKGYSSRITIYKGGHSGWNTFYDPAWKENGQSIYDYMLTAGSGTPPVVQPPVIDPPVVVPPVTQPPVTVSKRKIFTGSGNGITLKDGVTAGDTLEFRGSFSYIQFVGIKGTLAAPIVMLNGGQVDIERGFNFEDCNFFKVIPAKNMMRIIGAAKTGPAVSISKHSSNYEIANLFIKNKEYGFWIKNEADCDETLNYPNYVMENFYIHDNTIEDMGSQGMYLGTTDPNNLDRPIVCNGVVKNYTPTRLKGFRIINNTITRTGRPGIQLSVGIGENEIAYNNISYTGLQKDDAQGTGISLGGYTRAYVHNNNITNTFTWGIASLGGSGLIRIENNKIDSSGWSLNGTIPWATGIAVDTRTTSPIDSTIFSIKNNALGAHTHPSLDITVADLRKSMAKVGNEICNNWSGRTVTGTMVAVASASIQVEAGIKYSTCGVVQPPPVTPPPVTPTKTIIKTITLTIYSDGSIDVK